MNFNDAILAQGADALFPSGAANYAEFGEVIVEEGDLKKVFHRSQELSPISPQIYQQVMERSLAFLFGIRGYLA